MPSPSSSQTTTSNISTPFVVREDVTLRKSSRKLGVGVVGCGYWGPNLLRNFHSNRDCHLHAVADLNLERLAWAQAQYPHIKATTAADDLIELRGTGRDRVERTMADFAGQFRVRDRRRAATAAQLDAAGVEDVLRAIYRPRAPRPVEAMRLTFSLDLLLLEPL